MTTTTTKRRSDEPRTPQGKVGNWFDERLKLAGPVRTQLNKVFPDHWSFMMGEIALYSFIILLLTGTYLTFFFDPSMAEVTYHGRYVPLDGITMSRAYASTIDITFDVRGGLIVRQIHHWAALLFVAAMLIHMCRVFFTGAFRKPREINWLIGLSLIGLGIIEGFVGYSLPDDLLSGTGLRIADAIILSIPVIGTWLSFLLFGGPFPGHVIIDRFYIAHVLLIPAILAALIGAHLALVVRQKHTQFPGHGRTEGTVSGERVFPVYAAKAGGFFFIVFGVCAALGGFAQINPVWLYGPYTPSQVSSGSQPDWYMMFLDGSTRLPVLGDQELRLRPAPAVLADGGPAVDPVHDGGRVSVHRSEDDQGPLEASPASATAGRAGPYLAGLHGAVVLRRAVPVRRQRHHREGVRHLAERDDVGRPDRAAGRSAGGVPDRLPRLPGAATA
jgi:Cytochrome b subunit of the bc complex